MHQFHADYDGVISLSIGIAAMSDVAVSRRAGDRFFGLGSALGGLPNTVHSPENVVLEAQVDGIIEGDLWYLHAWFFMRVAFA